MNTTIYLTQEEQDLYKNVNPYTRLEGISPTELFKEATYPYFAYYSTKNTEIKTVPINSPIKQIPEKIQDGDVCVVLTKGRLACFFLNKFKDRNKQIFYIDSNFATKDNESTWKILEDNINMKVVKTVCFIYPHFSKLIHIYRIKTIYGKNAVDITY